MGNLRDIEHRINRAAKPQDAVRRRCLRELFKHTDRSVIAYYSAWLQKPGAPSLGIGDADLHGLMTAVHKLPRENGLDLILHTPGGEVAATEGLGKYLRAAFPGNIRVLVPQLAMSGGTLLTCAANRLVMGKHSFLGPIDPQIDGRPAQALLDEFEQAKKEIAQNPALLNAWAPLLSKYQPGLLVACKNASAWSKEIARRWLEDGMFAGDPEAKSLADKIAAELGSHDATLSHSRHYSFEECRRLGFKVEPLELQAGGKLQELLLSVHHSYIQTFLRSNAVKIIENHLGVATAYLFDPPGKQ